MTTATSEAMVDLPGGVRCREDWVDRVRRAGLDTVPGALETPAEVVREDRYNDVRRLRVAGTPCYLKTYRYTPVGTWLLGLLKGNPAQLDARRELRNVLRLRRAGVPTPEPIAAGASPGRGFLLTRAVEDGVPLDEVLRDDPAAADELLAPLARLVRTMHDAGIYHRDLYLCHVLRRPSGELCLLDLQRAEPARRTRWRTKDLAALEYSARRAGVRRSARLRFLRRYRGPDDPGPDDLVGRVRAKARRIARHGRKG